MRRNQTILQLIGRSALQNWDPNDPTQEFDMNDTSHWPAGWVAIIEDEIAQDVMFFLRVKYDKPVS